MLKAELLRAQIVAHNQFFRENPDQLEVYVKKAQVISTGRLSPSFTYVYDLNVLAMDYPGNIDDLTLPILAWAYVHQPELLFNPAKREDGIGFEAEILNNDTADILYVIKASESVIVTKDPDGKVTVTHRDQPRHFEDEPGSQWSEILVKAADGDEITLPEGP